MGKRGEYAQARSSYGIAVVHVSCPTAWVEKREGIGIECTNRDEDEEFFLSLINPMEC